MESDVPLCCINYVKMQRGHGNSAHLLSSLHTYSSRTETPETPLWQPGILRTGGDGPGHHPKLPPQQREQPGWMNPSPTSPHLVPLLGNPRWHRRSWLFFSVGITHKQVHNQKKKRFYSKMYFNWPQKAFCRHLVYFLTTLDLRPRVDINQADEQRALGEEPQAQDDP